MKYRLKDRELQATLDEISDGDFTKRLEEVDPKINAPRSEGGIYVSFGKIQFGAGFSDGQGKFRQYQIAILFKDLILEKTYDPHGWNEWPKVTPPYDVPMRLEIRTPNGPNQWTCGVFVNGKDRVIGEDNWAYFYDGREDAPIDDQWTEGVTIRFRPWEDE